MKRTLTAVLMAATMIPILIWGDLYYIFDIFCLLLTLGAAVEFRAMLRHTKKLPRWIDGLAVALAGAAYVAVRYVNVLPMAPSAVLFGTVLVFGIVLVFVEAFRSEDFGHALSTVLYGSIGFAAIAILREIGIHYVIYILIGAMVTDTAAYFFGTKFGRHRLCPTVSPKKSVEGAIAGAAFGTAGAAAYAFALHLFDGALGVVSVLLVSFAVTAVAQVGDLVASKFKRCHGIKDYSNLFPGHGGILDRFDSSMFAAVFVLFVVILTGAFA
ncbi:MAG: phosphatidate cytidylyltransferase [Candidatus Izemoplasmatales bacterium]